MKRNINKRIKVDSYKPSRKKIRIPEKNFLLKSVSKENGRSAGSSWAVEKTESSYKLPV